MLVPYMQLCVAYLVKKVVTSWGLSQLIGVVHSSYRPVEKNVFNIAEKFFMKP